MNEERLLKHRLALNHVYNNAMKQILTLKTRTRRVLNIIQGSLDV